MIVEHFLKWKETAGVRQRAAAAAALARAFVGHDLAFDERCAAEAALTLLLDDPSEKVRLALADALSMSPRAPAQVIAALADDQPDVAGMVLARSPLFSDADLVDRLAEGDPRCQVFIAMRPQVSMQVSAAICEVGTVEACMELLANAGAGIAAMSFRRMAERHGDHPGLRTAMLRDRRLPAETRHALLVRIGEALRRSALVKASIGERRATRITRDACLRASLALTDQAGPDEHMALAEHLRFGGELTAAFLVRAVACGKIDFFGAALVCLSGREEERVRSVLATGGQAAVRATLRAAGLPPACAAPVLRALDIWRGVANRRRLAGAQEVAFEMRGALGAASGPGEAELATLLDQIHLELLRDNARSHALAIAAA